MIINGDLLNSFILYQQSVIGELLPLFAATVGIFIAFAIANSMRFFIQKLVR